MHDQVITTATVADPKSKYGDAKASTRHFVTQRVTGAINILFILFLVFIVASLAGRGREEMVATLGNFWIGIPFAVLLAIVTIHMRNGMRDTLEDYVAGGTYRLAMALNTLFSAAIALVGVVSILKLVFWG